MDQKRKPVVVLIHGFFAHRILMLPLALYLRRCGFQTRLFGYRSCLGSIELHASRLKELLKRLNDDPELSSIMIVSHSMGGIVTRAALLQSMPEKLTRVVMLGPPNQGSPVASFLSRWFVPFILTLRQISARPSSYVRSLPEPDSDQVEFGIVSAQFDRVIPRVNSLLDCQTDQVTLRSGHNGLLVRPVVFRQVKFFLRDGRFDHSAGT